MHDCNNGMCNSNGGMGNSNDGMENSNGRMDNVNNGKENSVYDDLLYCSEKLPLEKENELDCIAKLVRVHGFTGPVVNAVLSSSDWLMTMDHVLCTLLLEKQHENACKKKKAELDNNEFR